MAWPAALGAVAAAVAPSVIEYFGTKETNRLNARLARVS